MPARMSFKITPLLAALVIALCAGLTPAHEARADQVGTAIIDGKTVILDGDGSWKYEDGSSPTAKGGCETIKAIEVCLEAAGWKKLPKSGQFETMYINSDKYYFGVIAEAIGSNDGYTYQTLQSAIITNAANGAKVKAEQIPVLGTAKDVLGTPGLQSVSYGATISGTPFVFHNVFKIYTNKSVQFVFWGVGKSINDEFKSKIDGALAKVKF